MADMLADAVAWLDTMRTAHMSSQVTYQRGAETVDIDATFGTTTYEVADDVGGIVKTTAIDFLVSADALVIGGSVVLPKLGDRLIVQRGLQSLVFEVLDLGGVGHYRQMDPHGTMLRLHTKYIGESLP